MSSSAPSSLPARTARAGPAWPTLSLFLASVLCLFLELMLIRWVGTELPVLSYLQNSILLVCFMGLGMGYLTCSRPFVLRQSLMPLFFLALLLAVPTTRIGLARVLQGLRIFEDWQTCALAFQTMPVQSGMLSLLALGLTFVILGLLWHIFVPFGRLLGQLMNDHSRPIWAYSVNVAGSLLGIWLFVLLSVACQPPVTWFAVMAGFTLAWRSKPARDAIVDLGLLGGILCLGWLAGREPGWPEVYWSPYQKLAYRPMTPNDGAESNRLDVRDFFIRPADGAFAGIGESIVMVNNGGYQAMIDLSDGHTTADPERYPPALRGMSQYDIPLLLHPRPTKMLVVGAGTGNDVAAGLRHGVRDITAVDIDPVIIALGRQHHPERPYDSPFVRVVNDDARSFFATTSDRFDLIVFGLLDSPTTTGRINERLDHFVYTRESLERARALLAEGGVLVLSFEVLREFSPDRMAGVLRDVWKQEPICFRIPRGSYGWGGVMLVTGDLETANQQIAGDEKLAGQIARWQREYPVPLPRTAELVTDDWPYIYLENPHIPMVYYLLAALLGALFFWGWRRLQAPQLFAGWSRGHWHFFFFGAAFLLLEVQNISKAAVVLGNTWWVNAVIISGILATLLLANGIAARFPNLSERWVWGLLTGTCLGLYGLDISRFGGLPFVLKAGLVGALTSLPMLFSGVLFTRAFAAASRKDTALGANLMGALAGGVLQAVTFITGMKFLLLLVATFYGCAYLTRAVAGIPDDGPPTPRGWSQWGTRRTSLSSAANQPV
jgi:spermidine synthase